MSFVTVRDIFQSYDGRPILERVNLDVAEGTFISDLHLTQIAFLPANSSSTVYS